MTLTHVEKHLKQIGDEPAITNVSDSITAYKNPDLSIVVLGEYSRGKSTFINALLEDHVMTMSLVPTKCQITRIIYHRRNLTARVCFFLDQLPLACKLDELAEFETLDSSGNAKQRITHSARLLKTDITLLDSPGTNR